MTTLSNMLAEAFNAKPSTSYSNNLLKILKTYNLPKHINKFIKDYVIPLISYRMYYTETLPSVKDALDTVLQFKENLKRVESQRMNLFMDDSIDNIYKACEREIKNTSDDIEEYTKGFQQSLEKFKKILNSFSDLDASQKHISLYAVSDLDPSHIILDNCCIWRYIPGNGEYEKIWEFTVLFTSEETYENFPKICNKLGIQWERLKNARFKINVYLG